MNSESVLDVETPDIQAQEQKRGGTRFWVRIILFALPFTVPFMLLTGGLIYIGESMPLALVVQMQMGESPVLYRPRYGARDMSFKLLSTNTRRPEVLALGSSRILQFRSMFFNRRSDAFYNAGAPAWTLRQVEEFLYSVEPSAAPRILFLSLDPPWFNDAYVGDEFGAEADDFGDLFLVNRSFLQDALAGEPFDVGLMLSRREPARGGLALGMRAIRDGHGFRNDGSEQYGDFLVARYLWPENERQRHLDLLRDGQEMYVRGDTVSESAMQRLERVLQYAQERGIYVIGFSPPYMPTLYDQMTADGQHEYAAQLTPRFDALFNRYGFAYFDFSDGGQLGANDGDFFDGWHASERVYLRLYIEILRRMPDTLGGYSDVDYLQQRYDNAGSTFDVFGNEF